LIFKVRSKISAGFTLVEIMVGMGLLSVLALAMAEMLRNSSQGQNNVKLDMDTLSAAMTAGLVMQDVATCGTNVPANISGPATFDNTLTPAQLQGVQIPLKKIVNKSGATLYQVGGLIDPTLAIQNIYLTSITIISPTTATAQIEIAGLKKGKSFLGSPIVTSLSAPFTLTTTTLGATSTVVGCGGGGIPKVLAQVSFHTCSLLHYGDDSHDCEGTNVPWGATLPDTNYKVYCSINNVATPGNGEQIMYGWYSATLTTFNYYIDSVHDYDDGRSFQMSCMAVE
jgi:prepilin-type N-terminal cleavage/methylation domain-containing protein